MSHSSLETKKYLNFVTTFESKAIPNRDMLVLRNVSISFEIDVKPPVCVSSLLGNQRKSKTYANIFLRD